MSNHAEGLLPEAKGLNPTVPIEAQLGRGNADAVEQRLCIAI